MSLPTLMPFLRSVTGSRTNGRCCVHDVARFRFSTSTMATTRYLLERHILPVWHRPPTWTLCPSPMTRLRLCSRLHHLFLATMHPLQAHYYFRIPQFFFERSYSSCTGCLHDTRRILPCQPWSCRPQPCCVWLHIPFRHSSFNPDH